MEINKVDTDDNLKRLIWKCKNLFLSLKILNTGEAKQQTLTEYAKIVNEVAKHYQENKLKLCQFYLDNQLSQHGLLWHSQVTPLLIELLLDRKPDDTTRCKLIDMTVHLVKQYGHDGILSDKLLLELFRAAIVHVIFLWQNDSNYSKSQEISDLTAQLLRECSKGEFLCMLVYKNAEIINFSYVQL